MVKKITFFRLCHALFFSRFCFDQTMLSVFTRLVGEVLRTQNVGKMRKEERREVVNGQRVDGKTRIILFKERILIYLFSTCPTDYHTFCDAGRIPFSLDWDRSCRKTHRID